MVSPKSIVQKLPVKPREFGAYDRIGAIGEELVKYHLLARGWDVINLNLIGNNKPNADLLAVKGKHVVRLQVKSSRYKDWVHLGWIMEGKTNVNGRKGDPADFFIFVGHVNPDEKSIHVMPAGKVKEWERRNLLAHKAHGRKNNSGYIYFGEKTRRTKFEVNRGGTEFLEFRNAWHLLEQN